MTDNLNDSIYKKAQNNEDSLVSAEAQEESDFVEPDPTPVQLDIPAAAQSMEVDF